MIELLSRTNPNVYIIAGPNGAGKTTFATEFLPQYAKCKNFVNADLIAFGLAPFSPESAAIKAGRILLEQLRSLSEQKADFAFESTLSGTAYVPFLKKLKSKGYVIHIFYLWVPKVGLSLARIKERVAKGGHEKAMRSAVLKVVEEHKKSGVPLAVWQDGKVVRVKADKLRGL